MAEPKKYSTKIGIPQYVPKGNSVSLNDTVNVDNFKKIIDEIEIALKEKRITDTEAHYLRLAATRWIKFDYGKVAEYFCSSACSDEMQKLLQRSAMVLLDIDDALRIGVVNCKSFVDGLREESLKNKDKGESEDTEEEEVVVNEKEEFALGDFFD